MAALLATEEPEASAGRPLVEAEVRALIRRLSIENPLWGAPRMHGELLKLGYDVAETTVGKYMVRRSGPSSQSWRTFLRNHASEIVAIDFLTVPTAIFQVLYVFVVLSLDRRRIVHFYVTDSPTAEWTSLQLVQAFPFDTAFHYVIRDRDSIYGEKVVAALRALGIKDKVISYQSPWQNGYVERVIGTIRRECLDLSPFLADCIIATGARRPESTFRCSAYPTEGDGEVCLRL